MVNSRGWLAIPQSRSWPMETMGKRLILTGITFNSVYGSSGSKVVNPITTIMNELMIDDPTLAVSDTNLSVARAMGLMNVVGGAGAQVDFTKFDPISNQVFGDVGTASINADLATVQVLQPMLPIWCRRMKKVEMWRRKPQRQVYYF